MGGGGGGGDGDQLSGVPWGGLNLQHMVAMGHGGGGGGGGGSRRGASDRHDYDPQLYGAQPAAPPYGGGGPAYGADDRYFDHSASSPSYSYNFSGDSSSSSRSGTRR